MAKGVFSTPIVSLAVNQSARGGCSPQRLTDATLPRKPGRGDPREQTQPATRTVLTTQFLQMHSKLLPHERIVFTHLMRRTDQKPPAPSSICTRNAGMVGSGEYASCPGLEGWSPAGLEAGWDPSAHREGEAPNAFPWKRNFRPHPRDDEHHRTRRYSGTLHIRYFRDSSGSLSLAFRVGCLPGSQSKTPLILALRKLSSLTGDHHDLHRSCI